MKQTGSNCKKRVLIALSGGVDSAAAAHLLREQGYQLTAVTLDLYGAAGDSIARARAVCDRLGIDHQVVALREQFNKKVVARYIADYAAGLTPNPCMVCNQTIKFGLLYDFMLAGGYDYLATGHYALKRRIAGHYYIARATTRRRDQSYFLYHLSSAMRARLLFPLGHFKDKALTYQIAATIDRTIVEQPESVGVCFTKNLPYSQWLDARIGDCSGLIVDRQGRQIGRHDGFYKYTIGQKSGLPATVDKGDCVLAIDAPNKCIVVGPERYCQSRTIELADCHLTRRFQCTQNYDIKIFNWGHLLRGRALAQKGGGLTVQFDQAVRAVALGQYAVFYDGDVVVGGGKIVAKDSAL